MLEKCISVVYIHYRSHFLNIYIYFHANDLFD